MDTYEKKIREYLNNGEVDELYKNMLLNLFPELKESEDERIRKGLIKAVSRTFEGNKLFGTDVTMEEALAWLEKQGEKKPTDNIEPKFKVGDAIKITGINNGHTGYSILNLEDGYYYNWKLIDKKPAWSEEDEEHIDSLLKRLDGLCRNEFERTRFAINEDGDWLKSLKQRIGG